MENARFSLPIGHIDARQGIIDYEQLATFMPQ